MYTHIEETFELNVHELSHLAKIRLNNENFNSTWVKLTASHLPFTVT